jgi:hypothetical protein
LVSVLHSVSSSELLVEKCPRCPLPRYVRLRSTHLPETRYYLCGSGIRTMCFSSWPLTSHFDLMMGNWHQIGARYKKNVSDCKGSKSDNSDLSADRSDRQLERSRFIYPSVMMRRSRRLYGLTTTGSRASLRTSLRGDCLNMPKPCVPRFTRMQVPSRVSWHAPVDQQSWSSGSNKDTRAYQSTWFPSPMRLW